MAPDEAIQVADKVLLAHIGSSLTDIQRMILRESLAGKGYESMEGYAPQHIKNEGKKLWDLLSEALGEKVSKTSFKGALEKHLKLGGLIPQPPQPSNYEEKTWVGREALINVLLPKLQEQTRLLWITGISGIGKTALGECLASQAWKRNPSFQWIYLEILEGQSPDFASVAADLLGKLGDRDLDPQTRNNPEQLAKRLLQKFQSQHYWIQLDALERLLNTEQSAEFIDPYWTTFFQCCLTESNVVSRLVLTAQAFPTALVEFSDRYPNTWSEIRLNGLLQVEQQLDFFSKRGLTVDSPSVVESPHQDILTRIAQIYEGHPLVLKVIAEDILQEFEGNVERYWQVYQLEFEQVARELQAIRLDEIEYNEALDRKVRERIRRSIEQLPSDALSLLCRSAVFRRPVPKKFWLAVIGDCSIQRQKAAYRCLGDRALIEREDINIRQHNLICSVAYDLLKADGSIWEVTERQAAHLWLTAYKPSPDVPNLETVRGYLEAFAHYCEVEDWHQAWLILTKQQDNAEHKKLSEQLSIWGFYKEQAALYRRLLGKLENVLPECECLNTLGITYCFLGDYPQSILYHKVQLEIARICKIRDVEAAALGNLSNICYLTGNYAQANTYLQQSLSIAQENNDYQFEGSILAGLGNVCSNYLGNYSQALEYYQRSLTISRKTGDRLAEGTLLGNIGGIYVSLGDFSQASKHFQQHLSIAQEIGDRNGEARALGSLATVTNNCGDYLQAIEYCQQKLIIVREIGDRRGEGLALGELSTAYFWQSDYHRSISYGQQFLIITREIGDRDGESSALGHLGNTHYCLGNYPQAIEYHQQQLNIAREIGDYDGEKNALGSLGTVFGAMGSTKQAMEYTQGGLVIARKIGDRQGESRSLGGLGTICYARGDFFQAIEYHQQNLNIAREIGDRDGEWRSLGSLGNAYLALGNHSQAIDCFNQSLVITRSIKSREGEATVLGGIGNVYSSLGDPHSAIEFYQQELEIVRGIGDRSGEGIVLGNLGKVYDDQGKYSQAIEYYQQLLSISQELGDHHNSLAQEYCEQALELAAQLDIPLVEECRQLKEELENVKREEK
jgi:tetratricopeptide (TPR) repeat protein